MAKVRVYEWAKQLDVQSKDIVSFLAENGIEVKSDILDCIEHCVEKAQEHVRMAEHVLTEIKEKIDKENA